MQNTRSPAAVTTPDGINALITAAEAATLCGVAESTIYVWVHRGTIKPSGLDERNRKLYRLIDIAKAEQATRRRARR